MARVIKNKFSSKIEKMEQECSDQNEIELVMGKKREMRGIFYGELDEGMIEAGQGSGLIKEIPTATDLMSKLIFEYNSEIRKLKEFPEEFV